MTLCTIAQVLNQPLMTNNPARPVAWLNDLLLEADAGIKSYLKRDIELGAYVDCYDGMNQMDLVIRQRPVWMAQTNLVAPSIGAVLPQSTINVVSTAGFNPGTGGNPNCQAPIIGVTTGNSTFSWVTYTGTTPTSFTGCSGGSGTLQNLPATGPVATNPVSVYSPVIWYDPSSARGQSPTAFASGTQYLLGAHYMVITDMQGRGSSSPLPVGVQASKRGLIRRWGGGPAQFAGFLWPQNYYGDKLAGARHPCWPIGDGAVKVAWSAGYLQVPADLAGACAKLVSQLVRINPTGRDMSSENLGAYSYSVLSEAADPELGTIRRILARYRESSWSSGN
ncbi:MAG: hypothetical protein KGL39_25725 [Patescibacteria group bacterium]|nr:hypothetical protein [Patescibacteria group bacterium]